jgi:hypothetical protein
VQAEIVEYEKIVKFSEDVLAGSHPRVTIPRQWFPKVHKYATPLRDLSLAPSVEEITAAKYLHHYNTTKTNEKREALEKVKIILEEAKILNHSEEKRTPRRTLHEHSCKPNEYKKALAGEEGMIGFQQYMSAVKNGFGKELGYSDRRRAWTEY